MAAKRVWVRRENWRKMTIAKMDDDGFSDCIEVGMDFNHQ